MEISKDRASTFKETSRYAQTAMRELREELCNAAAHMRSIAVETSEEQLTEHVVLHKVHAEAPGIMGLDKDSAKAALEHLQRFHDNMGVLWQMSEVLKRLAEEVEGEDA